MKVTADMKIREVLELGEHLLSAFVWLAPEFERLNYPKLRRAMSGRVTVAQAARIARIPVSEALYVLNLAAGVDSEELADELQVYSRETHEFNETNPPRKPLEILGLKDTDPRIIFVDVIEQAEKHLDPMPKIAKGLVSLKLADDVLLVHHPFDPYSAARYVCAARLRKLGGRTPSGTLVYLFLQTECGGRRSHSASAG